MIRLSNFKFSAAVAGLLCLAIAPGVAHAAVTLYSSEASFTSAAGALSNKATFQSFTFGSKGPTLVDDGILFTSLPGGTVQHDVFIATPNTLTNTTKNPSTALTANGDENFRIQLNGGATFGSIGFDFISNRYNNPTITLFGVGGASLGTFTMTSAKNAMVYFGAISDVAIAYAETTVDRGYIEDTAYDNVAIGPLTSASGVPEPATWAMMLVGFGGLGAIMRHRRGQVALSA